jgi:hypothetical protein
MTTRTPYRLMVGLAGRQAGFMGWTREQVYPEARLPSAGSFLYPGLHAVRRAALAYLADPTVGQVQVRTDQDRHVWTSRCA